MIWLKEMPDARRQTAPDDLPGTMGNLLDVTHWLLLHFPAIQI